MHRRNRIHRSGVGHWRFPTSSGDWITELNPPRSSTRSQCDVLLLFLFTEFSLFLSLFIGRAVHGNVMIDLDWTSPRPIIERHQSATVCEIPPFGIGRRKKKEKKKPLNRFSVSETWKIILKNNKNLSHIDWRSCRTGRWNRRRRRRADADAAADRCDADGRRPGRWSAVPSTWSHFLLPFILISWYSSWYGFDSFFITWKKNNCWTLKWVVLGFYRVGCVDWQRPLIGCFLFGRFFLLGREIRFRIVNANQVDDPLDVATPVETARQSSVATPTLTPRDSLGTRLAHSFVPISRHSYSDLPA